eukprot:TRINITY_DN13792_c0_g2_i4.p1 TRINITY_DN13792_c0_g2~~TRINITY_DN13792_c0_g2_i4.p1  ORF type:complete len:422 (-),score=60.69 TRINITY_DN13792_c0_g2_i4:87-1352(-)
MSLGSTALCRCICGSRKDDFFDSQKVRGEGGEIIEYEDFEPEPRRHVVGVLTYDASSRQPLRGVPIREGPLYLLSADEEVSKVNVLLYVNGFSFKHNGSEYSYSFSPFALVRNCKFQATTSDGIDLANFRCFKVSLFTQGSCFYFGARPSDFAEQAEEEECSDEATELAEEERSRWVLDISRAIRVVTQSLFPTFQIACEPLSHVPMTQNRLMAGYLAHHDDADTTSVIYCELQPHNKDQASLIIYENESCDVSLREIHITDRASCSEKVGISCTCFTLEEHLFSAHNIAERKLWLRAISNIKVKVQNRAPIPTAEELKQYRAAIRERMWSSKESFGNQAPMDALLAKQIVKPLFPAPPAGYEDGFFADVKSVPKLLSPVKNVGPNQCQKLAEYPQMVQPCHPAWKQAATTAPDGQGPQGL